MYPSLIDAYRFAPELIASGVAMLIMLVDPFLSPRARGVSARLALFGALGALASVVLMAGNEGAAYFGLFLADKFSVYLHLLIFGVAALVILSAQDYLEREGARQGEFYALVLFASAGMGVMAGANELLTAFIGLEVSSIASYVLASYRRDVVRSNESAMKYFLLGSFATAFFLYGVAMVYGATGTTFLRILSTATPRIAGGETLLTLGLGLMFVGLGFKIAAAPFQVWTPDVYEGAPAPVTALLASAPKAAAFALLMRVLITAFGDAGDQWFWLLYASAALTMIVGNFAALLQTSVKRMLAYSSIAHAGYLLVALAARNDFGLAAVLFYLVAYALMKLGAFTLVSHLSGPGEQKAELDDFAGLATRQPVVAACLSLFLLSLLGLPLTAGFLGKLYIFQAGLEPRSAEMVYLVILMALASVVGAFYYLRVIWVMCFREAKGEVALMPLPNGVAAVVFVTALGTLFLFFFPGALFSFAAQSAAALR